MLLLRDAVTIIREHLARALVALVRLSEEHGASPMIGRTLTQWALPITFGDKVAGWRTGLEEALADLASLTFPVQVGGPVGTSQAGAPVGGRGSGWMPCPPGTPTDARSPEPATPWWPPPTPAGTWPATSSS